MNAPHWLDLQSPRANWHAACLSAEGEDTSLLHGPHGARVRPAGITGAVTHAADWRVVVIANRQHIVTLGIDKAPPTDCGAHPLAVSEIVSALSLPAALRGLAGLAASAYKKTLFKTTLGRLMLENIAFYYRQGNWQLTAKLWPKLQQLG